MQTNLHLKFENGMLRRKNVSSVRIVVHTGIVLKRSNYFASNVMKKHIKESIEIHIKKNL